MAARKSNPSNSKKEPLFKTIFVWAFDISWLGLMIWFFHQPANQLLFWNTVGSWASGAVVSYVDWRIAQTTNSGASQKVETPSLEKKNSKSTEAEPLSDSKLAVKPVSDQPVMDAQYSPPPEFQPPPLIFDPQEHEVKKSKPFLDPRPVDEEGERISRIKTGPGKPVKFEKKKVNGIPLYLATIDLTDPQTFLQIALPKDAPYANSAEVSYGSESFESIIKRHKGAVAINGTFFSKDKEQRVMGNMVSEGKVLKYSRWEDYGTTLGLRVDNQPEMITARVDGQPNWSKHWFSLTCGPRLLKDGELWIHPEIEGFSDSHVLGATSRCALGYNQIGDKLYVVNFLRGLSLSEEAKLMKAIGCYQAMNLDGGASKALAYNGKIVMKAGRPLTNVLIVYDCKNIASQSVVKSLKDFQTNGSASEYIPVKYSSSDAKLLRPGT